MKKLFVFLLLTGAATAGFWLYGFLDFVQNVASLHEPNIHESLEPAEAIVVLTGGSERVATGIELLESGNGKKLFISGVHKNLSLEGVLRPLRVPADLRLCCIALGYQASSTSGNAEETQDWLKAEGYTSLRLVTANYHMPRSLLLFRTAMPNVTIVPYPVAPDNVKLYEWWLHPGTIDLLATEYCKFLLTKLEAVAPQSPLSAP
jgi:uncharacterized SAM-binding protein YcdF (DUF218 family)